MELKLFLCVALVFLLASEETIAKRSRKQFRPRRRWSNKLANSVNIYRQPHLQGPNSLNSATYIPPPTSLNVFAGAPGAPGVAAGLKAGPSGIRFSKNRLPHHDANFGNGEAPRRTVGGLKGEGPPPPDPTASGGQNTAVPPSVADRERIAYDFVIRYNYTGGGSEHGGIKNDINSMIREMQQNYGIEETGELDDKTVTMMMAPRCGVQDKPAAYTTFQGQPKFKKFPVTYKYHNYSPDLSPCQTRNIMKQAFREWEKIAEILFEEKTGDEEVDMMIGFGYREHGDGYSFDDANGLLAHAWAAGPNPIDGDAHFDDAEFWTLGKGRVTETYYGNAKGAPCKFPFIYKDKEYTSCTTAGRSDSKEWCSTTSNFDQDNTYGFCASELLFTYGGNAEGDPCVFPFEFLGASYEGCTTEGRSDGYRWCATTSSFDADTKWAFCPDRVSATEGGNSDGAPCSFPYTFNGDTYTDCTIVGRNDGLMWCSTTPNYDQDNKYGFCKNSGYSLLMVAAHEFGHAIGLDHSNRRSALMYPSYSYVDNFVLPADDRNGAQALYGARRTELPALVLEKCGGDISGNGGGDDGGDNGDDDDDEEFGSVVPATTPAPGEETPEDICSLTEIDAMLHLGNEIFVFRGNYLWRMDRSKTTRNRPYIISEQWPGGPDTVDAAYRRPQDNKILLFSGQRYWQFDGFQLDAGFPKSLQHMGFASTVLKVDAALNWYRSKNRKRSYFFVGNEFYRYNELRPGMDNRYPKSETVWHASFDGIIGAMEDPETKRTSLFFFRDRVVTLHNYKLTIQHQVPLDVYFNCRNLPPTQARPAPLTGNLRDKASP